MAIVFLCVFVCVCVCARAYMLICDDIHFYVTTEISFVMQLLNLWLLSKRYGIIFITMNNTNENDPITFALSLFELCLHVHMSKEYCTKLVI